VPEVRGALRARQQTCSAKCRAARSRQKQTEARRARDQWVRQLLEAALAELGERDLDGTVARGKGGTD
jgi:hypothetical protein